MYKEDFQTINKEKRFAIKLGLLILPATYLITTFFRTMACQKGFIGCSASDLVVVFPFYVPLSNFVSKLSPPGYFLLYLFSSAVYLAIFYHLAGWFEETYYRYKYRANFRLKRV